ncbi:MAG: MGMT family protein [Bdellovibrio sp.]|nr:MGMT family protein [Bdellovibrio sp.]
MFYTFETKTGWINLDLDIKNETQILLKKLYFQLSHKQLLANSIASLPDTLNALVDSLKIYFDTGSPIMSCTWDLLATSDLTSFQTDVYRATQKIPHGETKTYAWIARQVGNSKATRAVGQALKINPFPVLIPCHRVISQSSLGGFMGTTNQNNAEMQLKKWLLDLEYNYKNPPFAFLKDFFKPPLFLKELPCDA